MQDNFDGNKSVVQRSSGWTSLDSSILISTYTNLTSRLKTLSTSPKKIHIETKNNFATQAEFFGAYAKEVFQIYKTILEQMKTSQNWIGLQIRSTYHSTADYPDAVTYYEDATQDTLQIRGYKFNPQVFNFVWEDNSMSIPWTPWNWQLGILPNDQDETHYFFDLNSEKMIIGKLNPHEEILIYNF